MSIQAIKHTFPPEVSPFSPVTNRFALVSLSTLINPFKGNIKNGLLLAATVAGAVVAIFGAFAHSYVSMGLSLFTSVICLSTIYRKEDRTEELALKLDQTRMKLDQAEKKVKADAEQFNLSLYRLHQENSILQNIGVHFQTQAVAMYQTAQNLQGTVQRLETDVSSLQQENKGLQEIAGKLHKDVEKAQTDWRSFVKEFTAFGKEAGLFPQELQELAAENARFEKSIPQFLKACQDSLGAYAQTFQQQHQLLQQELDALRKAETAHKHTLQLHRAAQQQEKAALEASRANEQQLQIKINQLEGLVERERAAEQKHHVEANAMQHGLEQAKNGFATMTSALKSNSDKVQTSLGDLKELVSQFEAFEAFIREKLRETQTPRSQDEVVV